MKAKEYLQQLHKLDRLITNKLIEKGQWHDIAMNVTASANDGARVQSSGSQQRMADAIDKCADIEAEINDCVDSLIAKKREIIRIIETLDETEYDLLFKRYVQFMTLYEIALVYDKSYSFVTTLHGRALKHVQDILDGEEKRQNSD